MYVDLFVYIALCVYASTGHEDGCGYILYLYIYIHIYIHIYTYVYMYGVCVYVCMYDY
jgi:hypothetical protein